MTVVLRDVDVTKRSQSDCFSNPPEMMTLYEYLEIARRCIGAFASKSLAAIMLADEDAIAHVAEHLMIGHCKWELEKGRTLHSYLNQCSIWAIQVWTARLCEANKRKMVSLNSNAYLHGNASIQKYETVADPSCLEPYEILFGRIENEEAEKILFDNSCLTELQSYCLQQRYIHGKKLQEIADNLHVSRQAVDQHIKKGIGRLKEEYAFVS